MSGHLSRDWRWPDHSSLSTPGPRHGHSSLWSGSSIGHHRCIDPLAAIHATPREQYTFIEDARQHTINTDWHHEPVATWADVLPGCPCRLRLRSAHRDRTASTSTAPQAGLARAVEFMAASLATPGDCLFHRSLFLVVDRSSRSVPKFDRIRRAGRLYQRHTGMPAPPTHVLGSGPA
ncbi:hypothetical protein NSPZN2_130030 [Nitrospira defluvii]|uniref:Uncharacterized protein n=1 Tax=Nitrospira defluvii TaxID=330214 RepID=A0ABM8R8X5_9BACT|nr:hypothetical protein NSPZN2_130030 [Nitrospira defluvii]